MKKLFISLLTLTAVTAAFTATGSAASCQPQIYVGAYGCENISGDQINDLIGNLGCNLPELNLPTSQPTEEPTEDNTPSDEETGDVEQAPEIGVSEFEQQVLELVNAERAKYGISALSYNTELAAVAKSHSEDMRDRGFFAHNNLNGQTPFDRIKSAGISYNTAGENIAAGQSTPQQVVEGWMNSEGHRKNILNASFTQLGVGYASGGSYGHYWTQNFIG